MEEFEEDAAEGSPAQAAVENFNSHLEHCFKQFKSEVNVRLREMFEEMSERIAKVEARVKAIENGMESKISKSKSDWELQAIKKELNRQGQHSRKDNVRLFGAEEKKDENCKQVVCNIITKKVKVKVSPDDISVAHRLPKSKKQEHRPIIAKFKDRDLRQQVIWARKALKGTGISIAEDMTHENMALMRRAEDSGLFDAVWFSNARVRAKDKKGFIHVIDLYDTWQALKRDEDESG